MSLTCTFLISHCSCIFIIISFLRIIISQLPVNLIFLIPFFHISFLSLHLHTLFLSISGSFYFPSFYLYNSYHFMTLFHLSISIFIVLSISVIFHFSLIYIYVFITSCHFVGLSICLHLYFLHFLLYFFTFISVFIRF